MQDGSMPDSQHEAVSPTAGDSSPGVDRYIGTLDGVTGNLAHGWVMDRHAPDARVVVEILVDGHPAGTCVANQAQTTHESGGDMLHGFSYPIPDAILRKGWQVSARVANHPAALGAAIRLGIAADAVPAVGASQVWYGGGLVLSGWCWDPASPGRQRGVIACEGPRMLARTVARQPHPALVQMPSAEHGFLLELPWTLADGRPHDVHVTDDAGRPLAGSPIIVCVQPDGVSGLLGHLWPKGKDKVAMAPEALDSLLRLARSQERFAPAPIGFSQYPDWHALHARQLAATPVTRRDVRVHALISLDDGHDVASTLASVAAQRHRGVTAGAVTGDLRAGIADAIAAGGEFIVPISAGDRLAPQFVDQVLDALVAHDAGWVFTDCDQDGGDGERTNPWLKPSWDPDLFYGLDLVTAGSCWKADLMQAALARFPTAALPDWQCVTVLVAHYLAATRAPASQVARLVGVLYHRAAGRPARACDAPRSPACVALLRRLVADMADGATLDAVQNHPGLLRVTWPLPAHPPRVTLIVPTRDQCKLLRACVEGLLDKTDYPAVEVLVIDNQSSEPDTLAYLNELEQRGVRVLPYPHPFNYAAMNNVAVEHARGEVIGFVNNDIEVMDGGWLGEMVAQLLRPDVGVVGAKLLWKNGMVQHGGVVVGIEGLAAHAGNGLSETDPGLFGENQLTRRQSAVTAACMLIRRDLFSALGGFDADKFPVSFNDVDLCLRALRVGRHNLWTPAATLYHLESASRGKDDRRDKLARAQREQRHFRDTWRLNSAADPAYHPYLTSSPAIGPYGALALPADHTSADPMSRIRKHPATASP
jgi:GT2 family glycosyltransferase